MHRRVERLEFTDEAHLSRHTSVDFTVPDLSFLPLRLPTGQALVFVPLALLVKRVLKSLDVRDESGAALPVLTLEQNNAIALEVLRLLAEAALDGDPLEQELADELEAIVTAPLLTAADVFGGFVKRTEADGGQLGRIWAYAAFRVFANELARQFVLTVPIPAQPGDRRILKFSYEEEFLPPREFRPLELLGIDPVRFTVLAPALGLAQSYHAELVAPEDLLVARSQLLELRPRYVLVDWETEVRRTHLRASGSARGSLGQVVIDLRLRLGGLVFGALLTGVATTAILAAGVGLHAGGVRASPGIASTLVVAAPGIFAGFLALPTQHRLVKRLVRGFQALIYVFASLSFLAAASLAAELGGPARTAIWSVACALATLGTLLVLATVAMRPGGRLRKLLRRP
jgi:hypothetical protein